jgi:spore germination cell wall hydrolase CwlJ-like protein
MAPSINSYEEMLLAICMWREARGEGTNGMLAVGCVIRNRAEAWHQPIRDVIVGHDQFSSMTVKGDANTVLYPIAGDAVFGLAADITDGTQEDLTEGALYYADEAQVTSEWYRVHVMADPAHPVTVVIGRHTFRK